MKTVLLGLTLLASMSSFASDEDFRSVPSNAECMLELNDYYCDSTYKKGSDVKYAQLYAECGATVNFRLTDGSSRERLLVSNAYYMIDPIHVPLITELYLESSLESEVSESLEIKLETIGECAD